MTRKNINRWKEAGRWIGMLGLIVAAAFLFDWNEHRSPWGKEVQAAKAEMLKRQLCQ